MNELIKIEYEAEKPYVNCRELHEALQIETPYHKWFSRMCEYGFAENEDYITMDKIVHREDGSIMPQIQHDHKITIPMAKELCMLQRNEKGKEFRQYFIKVEEMWNSPEMVMKRALEIASAQVEQLKSKVLMLTTDNEAMKPKADYFDALVDRKLLTNFRDTSKELHINPTAFVNYLLDKKYVYRDSKGDLKPYSEHCKAGLFELKEYTSAFNGHAGTQTLITPKGRETFRLLLERE